MDTDKYRALLTVIDAGSLTIGAEELGYTVSGISRMVMTLEEHFGFALIIRDRKGIRPTPECERLLPSIRDLCHMSDKIEDMAAGIKGLDLGTIRIGTAYRRYMDQITDLIIGFTDRYPNIRVDIVEELTSSMLEDMKQHKLDLIVGSKREGDFEFVPLEEYEVYIMMNEDHPLAKKPSIPVRLLETEAFIHTHPNQDSDDIRLLKKHRIDPNIKYTTTDEYATYKMVEAGLGIGLSYSIQRYRENNKVLFKSLDPKETEVLGLAFPKGDQLSPSSLKFIEFVKEYYGI